MAPDRGVSKARSKHKMLEARSNPPMKRKNKPRQVGSIGKQIRDLERMLKRELPPDNKKALEKRVNELKEQRAVDTRLKLDRKRAASYKQVKFIERRKVERRIRRAELELRNASDDESRSEAADQLKQDLEYVRFFPKAEKYVSLFMKNEDQQAIARREKLREVIRANIAAAAAAGVELEESGSEEDYPVEMSDDDFFVKDDGTEPESSEEVPEAPENNNLTKINSGTSARSTAGIGSLGQTQKQMDEAADNSKRKRKRKRPKKK